MKKPVDEQELLRRLAELPRAIRPATDPWPSISQRISNQPLRRERYRMSGAALAVAASVMMALAIGLVLESRWARPPEQSPAATAPGVSTAELPALEFVAPSSGTLAASEAVYQAAFREFIELGESRQSLSANTLETIETSWAALRETELALAAALSENPDNRFLNQRMLELRARQLGFLKQLASLEQSNWRLTI